MSFANDILDAIEIIVKQVVEDNTTKIYTGVCKTIGVNSCVLTINGKDNTVKYYGGVPVVGTVYQVFIPFGNMSAAFIIVPGSGGGSGGSGVGSVNGKTGDVVLNAADVGAVATSDVTQTLGSSTTKVPSEKAVADALSGAGAGNMLKTIYDPTGSVAQAGGIPDYVEANGGKIDTIKVNGAVQPIANKEVDITVPTNNNQLTNGAGYITASEAPVTSVNTKTGAVTIVKSDIGLSNVDNVKQYSASNPPPYPITSVNGQTGEVALGASDVGALPTSGGTLTGKLTVGSANINTNGYVVGTWLQGTASNHLTNAATKIAVQDGSGWVYHRTAEEIKSDIGLSNVDNVKQYSATNPPPYPVASVNGKTGGVNLVASDVGAVSTNNITQTLGTSTTKVPSEKAVSDAIAAAGGGGGGGGASVTDAAINVKDYGAVGDGVTDDTTAVQNALNAAQGKTLIIDGVCKITAPLIVKDNTEIIGMGSRASGFDSYVASTLFTSANVNGIYKCLFENLRLRNRNLSPTDADGQYVGQVFSSLYESRVTECYVEHFAQICSRMARISSIDHCEMYYVNKSLVNDVIDSMIESNYINARNTAAGRTIMVYGLFSNSMFTNNFCDYWGTAFRLESGSKPSNVIGNTFDNCVSVFRDYVAGLSIVGNNYTNIKYVSANWQAGGQPSATIQATKWSVFKFDGATSSHTGASTQCCLRDTTFNSNTFGNCSYYIYVENGVSVYPVQRCKFSDNAWEGLLVDAAFTNPQSAYDNGGMRTVYFDFWEGQSVDELPSANLVSNSAKSVFTYDGLNLWYKKREIRNFNGAWRFADGSILSNEIWDLADRTYLSRNVKANTPRTYSTKHWYKVGYNGSEYTDAGYAGNPIVSNITKNGFTIQTKNTMTGLGFYLPYGAFTFSATLPTGIEAYLLVVPASGTLESRNRVASGATLKCNDVSKSYVLLFCSRTTTGTYSVSNISIRDNSYAEVSTAPYYSKEESQTKRIADIAGYYTSDTVEGALAEIGGTLDELRAAINTIKGVS